jgi:hypothetical protein
MQKEERSKRANPGVTKYLAAPRNASSKAVSTVTLFLHRGTHQPIFLISRQAIGKQRLMSFHEAESMG